MPNMDLLRAVAVSSVAYHFLTAKFPLASLSVAALESSSLAEQELPWLITFTQNFRNWQTGSAFYDKFRSLSTEKQFYLTFPFFVFCAQVNARNWILVAAFLAVSAWGAIGAAALDAAGYGSDRVENFAHVSIHAMGCLHW